MSKICFGDVVRDVKKNVDRTNNPYEFFVAGDHMDTEELRISRRGSFAVPPEPGPAFIRAFKPGQILYGSRRTYLKKVAVADFEGICANTTFVLETKDDNVFLQSLLPFLMYSERFTQYSINNSKGSTNPYILFSDLAKYEFNLPPIEEQHKLSELLWAANSAWEAYKNLLSTTDELVKSQFLRLAWRKVRTSLSTKGGLRCAI
jgi:type I restriction enzyme S subunit